MSQTKRKPISQESNTEPYTMTGEGKFFELRIKGQLSGIWAEWFEGMTIQYLENGEMLLCGTIVDQSALMGILNKLVRLNLTLISLNEIKTEGEKNESHAKSEP